MTHKRLLLITWDSGSSNYLESLFFPILAGLAPYGYECHVVQFSWATPAEVARIQAIAQKLGIPYTQLPIHRQPHAALGALWTVYKGVERIKQYVKDHQIQLLMPRSIMPAIMVNRLHGWLQQQDIQLIYDADGLSIEERVDFAGLKKGSFRYLQQKKEEYKILTVSDKILTRSQRAIQYLQENQQLPHNKACYIVSNGRPTNLFQRSLDDRAYWRKTWGLEAEDLLLAYTGSLGVPYAWDRMLEVFTQVVASQPNAQFLVLTRENPETIAIPSHLRSKIRIIKGSFDQIPSYLSAADMGISLRKQAPSLMGLAPIKIGEYLLMGLPLILSAGIGDTEERLGSYPFVYIDKELNDSQFQHWLTQISQYDAESIRRVGLEHYSLEQSIESYRHALED
ncbi:MAG: hypothetical protein ACXIUD_11845 [Mongoliitalea sp.]